MEIAPGPPPRRTAQGYVLPLLGSRAESPTTMTFRFSTEGSRFEYRSQQAVRVALPGVEDPWGAARLFSLSSSPTENGILAFTCRISDTPFKIALSKMRPGDTAQIYGPLGEFLYDPGRPSVFLAGGIGITPFRGMLRFAADTGVKQPILLLYSARVPEELLFRAELDTLAAEHPNVQVRYTITRPGTGRPPWTGRTGRIAGPWIDELSAQLERPRFYVAGLPEMVTETVQGLARRPGVGPDDVDYEVFRGF